MLKLAFLLIGPDAFRTRWYSLAGAGAFLLAYTLRFYLGVFEVTSVPPPPPLVPGERRDRAEL